MKYSGAFLKLLLLLGICLPHHGESASRMMNGAEYRTFYGLDAYPNVSSVNRIKIAVLDNGFARVKEDKGFLPASAKLIESYDPEFVKRNGLGDPAYHPRLQDTDHGRLMAQTVWAMTGMRAEGPQFYLLNATGVISFRRAVRYAIEEKVDIILYSQNRECCGNFDGGGFFNQIVNQATSAGIIWINAAGNYGGRVFNSDIRTDKNGRVIFPGNRQFLRLQSHLDDNRAQIILNWNSSGEEEESGTDKDLDLYVEDAQGNVLGKSELKQVLKKEALGEGESFLPRERLQLTLPMSKEPLRIVVRAKSASGWTTADKLRITVIPEAGATFSRERGKLIDVVEFIDALPGSEIFVPGDNPTVITVGDTNSYSSNGPTASGVTKPEVVLEKSDTSFSDGSNVQGTSSAAAIFAGIVAVLKAERPALTSEQIVRYSSTLVSSRPRLTMDPVRAASVAEISNFHRPLMIALEETLAEGPVLIGQKQTGQFVLAFASERSNVIANLCGDIPSHLMSNPTPWYVSFGRYPQVPEYCVQGPKVLCCTSNSGDALFGRATHFIEIRTARRVPNEGPIEIPNETTPSSLRIWKTPSPSQVGWLR
jgi:hypothetical protein